MFNNLKAIIRDSKYKKKLPYNYGIEDIYLVSFPKSGNTWLRFLIANAIKAHYGIQREVNFFSIHDIIPDLELCTRINKQGVFGQSFLPRIIKSHSQYNPYYTRVIFLIREPKDVMLSYYFFLINYDFISETTNISQFIRHKKYGINCWIKHTKSWTNKIHTGHIIKFFSYDQLKTNTEIELKKIMELIGIPATNATLKKAVDLSSKEKMFNSELNHMSTKLIKTQKFSFVRKNSEKRKSILSDEDKKYIEKKVLIALPQIEFYLKNHEN